MHATPNGADKPRTDSCSGEGCSRGILARCTPCRATTCPRCSRGAALQGLLVVSGGAYLLGAVFQRAGFALLCAVVVIVTVLNTVQAETVE
jgi:uncharacterized protein (DUF983 family)